MKALHWREELKLTVAMWDTRFPHMLIFSLPIPLYQVFTSYLCAIILSMCNLLSFTVLHFCNCTAIKIICAQLQLSQVIISLKGGSMD
jgi:hypothetical protein